MLDTFYAFAKYHLVYGNNLHVDGLTILERWGNFPKRRPLRNQSYVALSFTILDSVLQYFESIKNNLNLRSMPFVDVVARR